MNTRIRYEPCGHRENVLESVQTFVSSTTGARYKAFLFLTEKLYKIRNENSHEFVVVGGEKINNLNVLKRAIKTRLEKLGVTFDTEMRDRTFGLCQKGYSQKKHTETTTQN